MKEAEREKIEIFRREEANKAYHEKLAKIKQEEKRHLKATQYRMLRRIVGHRRKPEEDYLA